jgi:hypothetical protein
MCLNDNIITKPAVHLNPKVTMLSWCTTEGDGWTYIVSYFMVAFLSVPVVSTAESAHERSFLSSRKQALPSVKVPSSVSAIHIGKFLQNVQHSAASIYPGAKREHQVR